MHSPLFAVPLNMGTGTWIVTIVAGLSFVVMFGIASAFGDFQGLINTTLENDSNARERRNIKNKGWSHSALLVLITIDCLPIFAYFNLPQS